MLWATAAFAQKAPAPQPQAKPGLTTATGQVTPLAVDTFDGRVEPVDGTDDRTHLAYELRLTNITAANLTIERVRVLDPSSGGRVVDELSGDKLASRIVVFGGVPTSSLGLACPLFCSWMSHSPARRNYRSDSSTASAFARSRCHSSLSPSRTRASP